MRFSEFLKKYRDILLNKRDRVRDKTFEYLGPENGFKIGPENGFKIGPENGFKTLQGIAYADVIESYVLGKSMDKGPKVFRPTQRDFELLELVDLNIGLEDYVQPFPTVIIEIPPSYIEKCQVASILPEAKFRSMPGLEWLPEHAKILHSPQWLVIHFEKSLMCDVMFDSMTSIKTMVVPGDGDIEKGLDQFGKAIDPGWIALPVLEEEWNVVRRLIRASMNYMLLVDEVGHTRLPDPPHVERLRKSHVPKFREKGKQEPVYYGLAQRVKLVSHEHHEASDPTGRQVKPHHRRGHYRMQRFGQGLSKSKRIRILPVFVNIHLFLGDQSDTIYEAQMK